MAGRVGTGIAPGAEPPGALLPGHRWLRQAGQVIVGLLLTGLAAAVVWVLLALAGGLGRHFSRAAAAPGSGAQPGPGHAGHRATGTGTRRPGRGPPAARRREPAMRVAEPFMKAWHGDMVRAAAGRHLTARAGQARAPGTAGCRQWKGRHK